MDLRERLQAALGQAYTLERELGGGGMSRVFLAAETALGRTVVLKVLPPELAQSVSTERFRQEIRLAARLQHPHIVPLLSAGEGDGLLYYSMPYITGESLRARLAKGGELPVREAARVLRDLAAALAHAHELGVVHRDIKPENILLSRGEGLVTDFGVAKAISASRTGGDSGMTSLGVALGTPAYMAPEQAAADPGTDHRADIYGFGCVAYELLTGQPPFAGRNAQSLLAAHATEAVEPVIRRRPSLPPGLGALVMRCLEKRPADRPQSATELLHLLEGITTPSEGPATTLAVPARRASPGRVWVVAIAAAVLVLALAGWQVWRRSHGAVAATGPARLAVLPFENLGAPEDEYFADGIADEVRGKLAAVPGLEVMARASSNQYRRSPKSPSQIGQELGVQYLLSGTVRWEHGAAGRRVRVSPELIRSGAGSTAWQESFDAPLTDVFQVQADIAGRVAQALGVALGQGDRERLRQRPTENLAAYDAFLRGERILITVGAHDLGSTRQAVGHYEEAVRLDDRFALGWARLSRALSLVFTNNNEHSLADGARRAADRALALAPDLPEAHYARGYYEDYVNDDQARAAELYRETLRLTPRDADVLSVLALAELRLGQADSAVAHLHAARAQDPRSALMLRRAAGIMVLLGRYDDAAEIGRTARAISPSTLLGWWAGVMERLARGDMPGARALVNQADPAIRPVLYLHLAYPPDVTWMLDSAGEAELVALSAKHGFDGELVIWGLALAQVAHRRGERAVQRQYADTVLRTLDSWTGLRQNFSYPHTWRGLALAYRGDHEAAVGEARRALDLTGDDNLFDRPYFEYVLARVHLLGGDKDSALSVLARLRGRRLFYTAGLLRLDPAWEALRGTPEFEKLAREDP